jgi:hypothetical protein
MTFRSDADDDGTDFKRSFRRIAVRYPYIANEMRVRHPREEHLRKLPEVQERFTKITGMTRADLTSNRGDSRVLFIAVVVTLTDPLFFDFDEHAPYRLMINIGRHIRCSKGQILYFLKKVKNYWAVYPEFRDQVINLCAQIRET